jgi:hypothetical protein
LLFYSLINTLNMHGRHHGQGGYGGYGGGYGVPYGGGAYGAELRSDMWIQQNVPGGLNSMSYQWKY